MIENLFLNVGVMKAGTTWLYEQLKNHPDISFLPEKEIHYFSTVSGGWDLLSHEERMRKFFINVEGKSFERFQETISGICWYADYALPAHINNAWYQGLYKHASSKYCADFSNLTCNLDEAGWRRVRQNFSHKLKVTYCLRDPFKRAWSHYKFHMEWTGHSSNILSDGFEGFKNLLEEDWFKEIVRYDLAIKRLEKNLTVDEFKIVYFEDFRTSPQTSLDQLCEFLEIEKIKQTDSEFSIKVNPSQDIQMPEGWKDFLWDYLEPVYAGLDDRGLLHKDWLRRP